jgi:hypothetical protein
MPNGTPQDMHFRMHLQHFVLCPCKCGIWASTHLLNETEDEEASQHCDASLGDRTRHRGWDEIAGLLHKLCAS